MVSRWRATFGEIDAAIISVASSRQWTDSNICYGQDFVNGLP